MTLLLFGCRPGGLSLAESDEWIRKQLAPIGTLTEVASVRFLPLRKAAPDHDTLFDWLAEVDIEAGAAEELAAAPVVGDLLAEFRQLGMQPWLAFADRTGPPVGPA